MTTPWFQVSQLEYLVAAILVVGGLVYAVATQNTDFVKTLAVAGIGFLFGRRTRGGGQ